MLETSPLNSSPEPLIIHTDGGSRGNPGPAATGIVALIKDKEVHAFGKYLGVATNNEAEYLAVIHALEWVVTAYSPTPQLTFFLDSKLVVEQLSRRWKIKEPRLFELASKAWSLIQTHHLEATFDYVPRAQNWQADREVNLVLDNLHK